MAPAVAQEKPRELGAFLQALWPDASTRGITRATFDTAFRGLTPDPRVAAATVRQPEYGRPVGTYVNGIASAARIATAAAKAQQWKHTLNAVEQQYGVDRWTILAIWGIETSFGTNSGNFDVIRSLTTLALSDYRPDYFRDELLAALRILQDGHIARAEMVGSWAGAMGQPQFMPTNFLALAVDFDGDGRKNIWTSVPDVLASIAHFLNHAGWQRGAPWGCEVAVPKAFDYRKSRASYPEWAALGLRRADGAPLPADGNAILFFPSGAAGPAFLVGANFEVIKQYNTSDVFALAVVHLADRARGAKPFRTRWPEPDRQLSREERIALQNRMQALGYQVNDFEGRIDFDLRDAIRLEQAKYGMVPDGHPTAALLERIGARN
ncbi:MAG TPA: lytic murein transglycosylase [Xanthobacteraceae bacterium]|nr:lytic murein transglycosylase [Xanthobacteraceae bacterium]